jgi:hypothetical protein
MATEKDPTQELQAQVLDGIRKSQQAVIDGVRTWAETIQQLVPGAAQAAMPHTDQARDSSAPGWVGRTPPGLAPATGGARSGIRLQLTNLGAGVDSLWAHP